MTGQCKACKWWSLRSWSNEDDWGVCGLAASKDGERPDKSFTLAYAEDYESYKADLVTHETFGCVQFSSAGIDDDIQ